jgi:hypothetical protein
MVTDRVTKKEGRHSKRTVFAEVQQNAENVPHIPLEHWCETTKRSMNHYDIERTCAEAAFDFPFQITRIELSVSKSIQR